MEFSVLFGTAFLFGLAGSLHCVAMCGPITFALSAHHRHQSFFRYMLGKLVYNLGRVITYSVFGLMIGLFDMIFDIHAYQEIVSLILGSIILVVLFMPPKIRARSLTLPGISAGYNMLRRIIGEMLRGQLLRMQFALGLLNGFLPCGFVYVALAFAVMAGSLISSVMTMVMFGLGTIPIMVVTSVLVRYTSYHQWIAGVSVRRFLPIAAFCVALLFVLRGLSLDIPYISPKLTAKPAGIEQGCHVP